MERSAIIGSFFGVKRRVPSDVRVYFYPSITAVLLLIAAAEGMGQSAAATGLMARLDAASALSSLPALLGQSSMIDETLPVLPETHGLHRGRFLVVTGGTAGAMVGLHFWQQSNWWKNDRTRFHFKQNAEAAGHLDKAGHVYVTALLAHGMARSLQWSGLSENRAALWGSIYALAYYTHVEIQDGFAAKWGFDIYDQVANVAGAAWFYARHHVPFMQHFDLKFSYFPSEYVLSEAGVERWKRRSHPILPIANRFSGDYEGQTFWFSVRVWEMLPAAARPYWPSFLAIAGGVSVEDVRNKRAPAYRTYYLSLDIDFTKVIPQRTAFGRGAAELLNGFRVPMPAIRIHPSREYYWLYYGRD